MVRASARSRKSPQAASTTEFQYFGRRSRPTPRFPTRRTKNGTYTGGLYASAPRRYDFQPRLQQPASVRAYWTPELITVSFSENWPDDVDRTSVTVQPTTKTVTYGEKIGALASASMEPRSYETSDGGPRKQQQSTIRCPVGPDFVVEEPYQ